VAKRRWYQDNKQVYTDRNRLQYEEKARKLRELKGRPCMDCGGTFPPIVMDSITSTARRAGWVEDYETLLEVPT
jgi:hypothetical protein